MIAENVVETSRGKIAYFELGEGGRTLVFFHGWLVSPVVALSLMSRFVDRGFRVIAPYLPGHGDSFSITPNFTFNDLVCSLEEFLTSLSLDNLTLTGHSMGASASWEIIARGNVPVRKAVLWGAFINPNRWGAIRLSSRWLRDTSKKFSLLAHGGANGVHDFGDVKGSEVKVKGPQLKPLSGFINVARTVKLDYPVNGCPTLLMWGKEDKLAPYSDWQRTMTTPSNCTVKFFPGGHYGYIQSPQEFLKSLEDFIG